MAKDETPTGISIAEAARLHGVPITELRRLVQIGTIEIVPRTSSKDPFLITPEGQGSLVKYVTEFETPFVAEGE